MIVGGSVVQRFSLEGELDPSFGSGGAATIGTHERGPAALALQGDDIVVAIQSGPYGFEGQLVRLSPSGVVDASFGSGGVASAISPSSLAVDGEGRLVVGGEFPGVVRYDSNGALDGGFENRKPRYSYSHDHGTIVGVDPDQRILGIGLHLARRDPEGFSPPAYDFGVVRLHGGDDATAPVIGLRGRPRACVSKGFRLRLRVRDDAGPARAVVRLDGRRLLATRRASKVVRVPARRLRPGTHRIRVRARDGSDNVAVRRLSFRRCR